MKTLQADKTQAKGRKLLETATALVRSQKTDTGPLLAFILASREYLAAITGDTETAEDLVAAITMREQHKITTTALSAVAAFGTRHQMKKAVEEATELSMALQHYQQEKVDAAAVIDEIADMVLILPQLLEIFGRKAVQDRVEVKRQKLVERVKEGRA